MKSSIQSLVRATLTRTFAIAAALGMGAAGPGPTKRAPRAWDKISRRKPVRPATPSPGRQDYLSRRSRREPTPRRTHCAHS